MLHTERRAVVSCTPNTMNPDRCISLENAEVGCETGVSLDFCPVESPRKRSIIKYKKSLIQGVSRVVDAGGRL